MRPHEEWLKIVKCMNDTIESYINTPVTALSMDQLEIKLKNVLYRSNDDVFHAMAEELRIDHIGNGEIHAVIPQYNDILRRRHLICSKKY